MGGRQPSQICFGPGRFLAFVTKPRLSDYLSNKGHEVDVEDFALCAQAQGIRIVILVVPVSGSVEEAAVELEPGAPQTLNISSRSLHANRHTCSP